MSQRRAEARRTVGALRKQGTDIQPVEIEGRAIATTFWGKAWCDHLESLGDYENRLPRGRTYVRNGSVCHLDIAKGKVDALVSGSEIYNVEIRIRALNAKSWTAVRKRCAGRIGSLLELLQGHLSDEVMAVVTDRKTGLFPQSREITLECDCPDWATMCKHVAAALYGVGARLDTRPELLFLLRGVDQQELIAEDTEAAVTQATTRGRSKRITEGDLGDVFGIDLDEEGPATKKKARSTKKASRRKKATAGKKTPAKKNKRAPAKKKTAKKKPTTKKKATARKRTSAMKKVAAKSRGTKKTGTKKKAARKKKPAAKRRARR